MAKTETGHTGVILGDPAPWFGAPLVGEGVCNLQVAAGRWIVLSFLGSPANPRANEEIAALLRAAELFDADRIVFYGVLAAPPPDPDGRNCVSSSPTSVTDRVCEVPAQFGKVLPSMLSVSVLSFSLTEYVPK